MSVRIARAAIEAVRRDCAERAPDEACGLLLGKRDRVCRTAPAPNVAADPARRFEIDPAVLFAAHRAARQGGPAVVGCYHSHPAGAPRPSAADAAGAFDTGSVWLIVAGDGERAYRVVAGGRFGGRFEPVALLVDD
jgi:desampylase